MNTQFFLFDVDHGQCAGLHLPNGRWCLFDAGCTSAFSPTQWIARRDTPAATSPYAQLLIRNPFRFLKATISHLHCDHLADHLRMFEHGPDFLKTVDFDQEYLEDCRETSTEESWPEVQAFASHFAGTFTTVGYPDYGGVVIREMALPVAVARQLGGQANSRVNNASVVTRIDAYGNSILLCGDLEKEAWEAIIADTGPYGAAWRPFVTGIDVLVAPHHGHASAYSVDLLNLTKPAVVLVSVVSKDPHVDSRYCQDPVRGIKIGETEYKMITTRKQGHVRIDIAPPANSLMIGARGKRTWTFGDAALAVM